MSSSRPPALVKTALSDKVLGACSNKLQEQFHMHYMKNKFVMLGIDVTNNFSMDAAHYQVTCLRRRFAH